MSVRREMNFVNDFVEFRRRPSLFYYSVLHRRIRIENLTGFILYEGVV